MVYQQRCLIILKGHLREFCKKNNYSSTYYRNVFNKINNLNQYVQGYGLVGIPSKHYIKSSSSKRGMEGGEGK